MFKRVLSIMVALAFLWVIGCSEAPTTEQEAAETALLDAQKVEADQYASLTYQMAADTLNAAKVEMQKQDGRFSVFRRYGTSRQLFAAAQKIAGEATEQAQAEKERVRLETVELMNRAQGTLANAAAAFQSAPKGKGTKADLAVIKADLDALQQAHLKATDNLNNGNYLAAKAEFEVIIGKADSLLVELETAMAKKTSR